MKDLRVVSKLSSKVRRKPLSFSEHTLQNSLLFPEPIQDNPSTSFKQRVRVHLGLSLLNLCKALELSFCKQNADRNTENSSLVSQFFLSTGTRKPWPLQSCDSRQYGYQKKKRLFQARSKQYSDVSTAYINADQVCTTYSNYRYIHRFPPVTKPSCASGFLDDNVQHLVVVIPNKAFSLRFSSCFYQRKEKHNMIRPLLELTRETITILCKDCKMPVYPDQSNQSVQYSRNRIRKQIIPSIQYFINPKVENSLCKLAELLNNEQSFLYSIIRNTSGKMPL